MQWPSKSLGKEGSARGANRFSKRFAPLAFFYKKRFVLCTTSVSPLDRDKDTVLDPRKMLTHFSVTMYMDQRQKRLLITYYFA